MGHRVSTVTVYRARYSKGLSRNPSQTAGEKVNIKKR